MNREPFEELLAAASARLAAGPECPPSERFVELYAGRLAAAEAEALREHLVACPSCLEVARDARRFVAALAAPQAAAGRVVRPGFGRWRGAAPRWLGLAAALLVTAGVALLLARLGRAPAPIALPLAKAAWAPSAAASDDLLYRDADGSDPEVEASLRAAMVPYAADDFAAAERALARHLAAHPQDQRARFYRGVALLLLGRDAEAEATLARVIAMASPTLAGEARWYRALALVRLGARERAAAELGVVAAGAGPRRAEAARLLATLGLPDRP